MILKVLLSGGQSLKNIWVPLSGQIAQQRKVETIANNIANANTAGFKKDRLAFKEHLTALDKGLEDIDIPREDWSPDDFYRSQGAQNAYVKVDGSYTVHEQGPLQPTNNPLDLALHGQGFFEVQTPNGIRFTRKGNFAVSKDGELITDRGYKLLSAIQADATQGRETAALNLNNDNQINNRLIKLPPGSKVSISKEGEIFSTQGQIGKVSVVEFNDVNAVKKQGNSLYINNDELNIKRANIKTSVNQGFIEGSNVNAVQEMSELIRAHRHFENIQKAIQTYDTISGKAVNDIAKF
jgi:flagellar basal-body rod protein FlgF